MIATFNPCSLHGTIEAPPSKSMAHRYLIGAALSGKKCTLSGVDFSEDILASIDCLNALGAQITVNGDKVTVNADGFMKTENPLLKCRESAGCVQHPFNLLPTMDRRNMPTRNFKSSGLLFFKIRESPSFGRFTLFGV